MNRIGTVILMLCAMLATPVLGYWEYDGTSVTIGGPGSGSGSDPYGTWSWSASASGSVDYDVTYVDTSGRAHGNAACVLYTDFGMGLQRYVYGTSRVDGTSSYHWVPDQTSKEITVDVYVTVDNGYISYDGYALNYLGNTPTTSSSEAYVQSGGNATGVYSFYPYGYGSGGANTQGGSYAGNSWGGVDATTDESNGWQPSTKEGQYEGHLVISGSVSDTYTGSPWGNNFSATAAVAGLADAQGRIVVNGSPHFGGFNASAAYDITGSGSIYLSGNIDDRE